jgi:hypothetical protein
MRNNFLTPLSSLKEIAHQFDQEANINKKIILTKLSGLGLPSGKYLLQYHDLLLFLCAYPGNLHLHHFAKKELRRIAAYGKKNRATKNSFPENEGLPFANTVTRFSPHFLKWLVLHTDLKVGYDSFNDPVLSLNDILNITLPALLKPETTAGLNNEDLLSVLHIKPGQYIPFLLGQLEELFIERMELYVKLVPKNVQFSRAFNCMKVKKTYYHQDLLKQFNHEQLINEPLHTMRLPGREERQQLHKLIKNAMALTVREIDPATFLEEDTLRLYDTERGLTIAVYSMLPEMQLPLETYFGFTIFKNGIPVSYGGIWAFGKLARIGLNIFEPFRNGESGYILCQLLRLIKQAFGVSYFEIEPYQFGLDNPEGISSGAFWFYHKYGFRPVDHVLKLLAKNEYHKIKTRKNYRSSAKTLLHFTESNIGLNIGDKVPQDVLDVTTKILSLIKNRWKNNYRIPKQEAINHFCTSVQIEINTLNSIQKKVLEDIALWAMTMNIRKTEQLQLMKKMVYAKTKDDYAYQQLLLDFFEQ